MWNDLTLKNPVHDICEYSKDAVILQELPELVSILTNCAEILTEDHPIWEEILIFKNVQTKYKRILHCDKCLQLLQRVGGCVKKMVLLNLSKIYLDLGEKILTELHKSNCSSYFLPSQQQLEFILIRTQSAAKLICEALHYSRETFCYLIQKLKVGHLILNLMMATSVTARLNIVFKGLLVQLFDAYNKIYPWRKRLRRGGWEWSKTLELPEDLEAWINLEGSEYMKPKHLPKDQLEFLSSIFSSNNPEDISTLVDDDVILLDSPQIVETDEINKENEYGVITLDADIDNGVPIARSEVESDTDSFQNLQPSTSSTPQREEKSNQALTSAQKTLLKKIRAAKDFKALKKVWNNLDVTSQNLLPKGLTPEKIRPIEKVFLQLKRSISQVNKSTLGEAEKKTEITWLVRIAGLKLAKNLHILPDKKVKTPQKSTNTNKLKPVKSCKKFKELYKNIHKRLEADQKYEKCTELKKCFKRRRGDIKLLLENEEKDNAKQLIYSSSKFLLAEFLK